MNLPFGSSRKLSVFKNRLFSIFLNKISLMSTSQVKIQLHEHIDKADEKNA